MKVKSIVILFFALTPFTVDAQKSDAGRETESFGIFRTQDDYFQFMGSVKREGRNNPELMQMVPMINDIVLGQPIGSTSKQYQATGSTLGLLADPNVRKDLEMLDEQYESLQKSNAEIQERVAKELRDLDFSDMKSVTAKIMQIRDHSEQELQGTLLPHQIDRLRQIAAQNHLRRRSLIEIITSEPMKSQLEISDAQSTELRDAEKQMERDLEKQIAELRENARKKILSKLKQGQRERVEEIFGDAFEFQSGDEEKRRSVKPGQK